MLLDEGMLLLNQLLQPLVCHRGQQLAGCPQDEQQLVTAEDELANLVRLEDETSFDLDGPAPYHLVPMERVTRPDPNLLCIRLVITISIRCTLICSAPISTCLHQGVRLL